MDTISLLIDKFRRTWLWEFAPVRAVRYAVRLLAWPLLRHWKVRQARYRMEKLGLLKLLNERPQSAWRPDLLDNLFLYDLVRSRKPKVILEFGSGCSTSVISQALYENARDNPENVGKIYSLESEKGWADVTADSIPAHLRPFCEVIHGPVERAKHAGNDALIYRNVPDVRCDMLYLDGPAFDSEIKVVATPILLEDKFDPGFVMVVDGRLPNVRYLERHLQRKYHVVHRWLYGNSLFVLAS